MLWFTQRKALATIYGRWIRENNIKDCPESVIGFLVAKHLIDEDEARKFIKKHTESEDKG